MHHYYCTIINDLGSCGWCYRHIEWDRYALDVLLKKGLVLKSTIPGESNTYSLSQPGKYVYDALVGVINIIYVIPSDEEIR